jgi:hypothetical protein
MVAATAETPERKERRLVIMNVPDNNFTTFRRPDLVPTIQGSRHRAITLPLFSAGNVNNVPTVTRIDPASTVAEGSGFR